MNLLRGDFMSRAVLVWSRGTKTRGYLDSSLVAPPPQVCLLPERSPVPSILPPPPAFLGILWQEQNGLRDSGHHRHCRVEPCAKSKACTAPPKALPDGKGVHHHHHFWGESKEIPKPRTGQACIFHTEVQAPPGRHRGPSRPFLKRRGSELFFSLRCGPPRLAHPQWPPASLSASVARGVTNFWGGTRRSSRIQLIPRSPEISQAKAGNPTSSAGLDANSASNSTSSDINGKKPFWNCSISLSGWASPERKRNLVLGGGLPPSLGLPR